MATDSQALRAASDALLRDLEALVALEEQKRQLPLDDPALVELAAQIHSIASRVLARTGYQRELAGKVLESSPTTQPIDATPRSAASILAEWRDLERRAAAVTPGSAEHAEIEILTARLREEYRAAIEDASRRP